jgi:hypothetical protein
MAVGDRIGPGALDEVDELEIVDGREWVRAVLIRGNEEIAAIGQERVPDGGRPLRGLEARHLSAGQELDEAVVGEVVVRGDEGCGREG